MAVATADFIPIRISTITVNSVMEFDLYQDMAGKYMLYRNRHYPLSEKDLNNLKARGCQQLYAPMEQRDLWLDYYGKNLPQILDDEAIPIHEKVKLVREVSENILGGVLNDPTSPNRAREVVNHSGIQVRLSRKGESVQSLIINNVNDTSDQTTHAVNVGNLSILLGIRCGINNPEKLQELGIAAYLHDIGKILLTRGNYQGLETAGLHEYPKVGTEVLQKMEVVPVGALQPILEHQERLDGSGFPERLTRVEISKMGRIVGICDYFDESLGESEIEKPSPFTVLLKMRRQAEKFDQKILKEFIYLLGKDVSD